MFLDTKAHKIWATACLLLGIIAGIAGIATLFIIIFSSSKKSAYDFGMSILLILIAIMLISFSIEFLQAGKNKSKFEKLKEDIIDTVRSLAPSI